MHTLNIRLLGQPCVCIDESPCEFRLYRAKAILYYCVSSRKPVADPILRDLFWPGEGEDARHKLTEAVTDINSRVRDALQKVGALESFRACVHRQESVAFNFHCPYFYDVEEFERLVGTATIATDPHTLQQAFELYRGPFLETFYVRDADADFDDWVNSRREALRNHYHKLLHLLSFQHMVRADWLPTIEHLERLREDTPDEQVIYGLLMICYAVTGQRRQVGDTYCQYVRMVGEPPNAAMERLHNIIQADPLRPPQAREIIDRALQVKRHTIDAPLQEVFLAFLKETGAKKAPSKSAEYRRVLQRAEAEAVSKGFSLVGTLHLFLALCAENDAYVHQIRDSLNVSPDNLVQDVLFTLGEGADSSKNPIGHTLELKNVLQLASDFAEGSEADSIDLLHLWFALFREEHELLGKVLERYGLNCFSLVELLEAME